MLHPRVIPERVIPVCLLALALSIPLLAVPNSAAAQSSAMVMIDAPSGGITITNGVPLAIGGWAVDPGGSGTGITSVDVYLDGPAGSGRLLGQARYGDMRRDVAAVTGHPEWTNSGFTLDW